MPGNITFRSSAIVWITLLALALGGSTELWAQAVVMLLGAAVIMLAPPRHGPGLMPTIVLSCFLLLALAAFLPTGFGFTPEWRHHLADELHADLGPFRTPQPWLTLQSCCLLFFGVIWIGYLFSLEWSPAEKSQALRLFAAGVVILAAVLVATYVSGYRIPGWNQEENRGPFPNRNQTADVLAIGGVIAYVSAFKSLQKRQRMEAFWLLGLGAIGAALVITYSRAGILMFFGGIGVWHILSLFHTREGKQVKYTAMGLAGLLLMLSLFLLFGGSTLERFKNLVPSDRASTLDFRVLIQEDALSASTHSPIFGVGLGNFEPVFTAMRHYSASQTRTIHPESDWLWMVVEMGWLAPVLLLAGFSWWIRQCLPFALKSGEALRRAAMVAALIFICHGFVDVSGHRLGSFLAGMLLVAAALSPSRSRSAVRPGIGYAYRGAALVLAAIGSWWLVSIFTSAGPPTTATLARLQAAVNASSADGRLASVFQESSAALEIAPLDWTLYFHRASAEAFQTGGTDRAARDFNIARYLEPHWVDLCLTEGEIWLAAGEPTHCLDAWREALRRANKTDIWLYERVLNLAATNPTVHQGLKASSLISPAHFVTFLRYATPEEGKTELDRLLTRDPNLRSFNSEQQRKLFAEWFLHGDKDALTSALLAHEDWQTAGWPYLARQYAGQNDFAMASATALRYLQPPNLQTVPVDKKIAVLQNQFVLHPDNVVDGILLCQAQIRDNHSEEALETISQLEKLKDCPSYIFYLKAQLCVQKQAWDQAWDALLKFGIP